MLSNNAAPQLDLPITIACRHSILGAPIVATETLPGLPGVVEVVGGAYAGDCYVYINHLFGQVSRASHYTGSTTDVLRRMREHQRKWPKYSLTGADLDALAQAAIDDDEYARLASLHGQVFRRKQTFLAAAEKRIGHDLDDADQRILLSIARKHASNGLMMAANQRGIAWTPARVFRANRNLEFALKKQKGISKFCPICQGHDLPF